MSELCKECSFWVNNRCSLTTCCKKADITVLASEIDYSNVVIRDVLEEGEE